MGVLSIILFFTLLAPIRSQLPIPARYDGFVFTPLQWDEEPIILEAFMDPLCPDSRDAWPAVKEVAHYYAKNLVGIVHPFALPYHHNSFFTCRALHIINNISNSLTFPLLEEFFKHQDVFSNNQTMNKTPASVLDIIVNFASPNFQNEFRSGFEDSSTDAATRISFKYGCSRSVTGTPYFFLNGIPLYDADSSWDYLKWRSVIDPLMQPPKYMI